MANKWYANKKKRLEILGVFSTIQQKINSVLL